MKIYTINDINNYTLDAALFLKNKTQDNSKIIKTTQQIISDIKINGDDSLIKLCNQFDKTNFKQAHELLVSDEEIKNSANYLEQPLKDALEQSYQRIFSYHQKQLPKDLNYTDEIGITLGNKWQAIESIGIYSPGGSASYPSSVLMSAIPAIVAGSKELSLFTPATNNKINPAILYSANLCNIKKIYKIGGAQAVAAMAYGTKTIKKVDKICGPGNSYVAMAKKLLFGDVGIDMIAGPTDLTIIANSKNAKASWVAADALSQLEHGIDSKVFIITDNYNFAQEILQKLNDLTPNLDRQSIINSSIQNSAIFVIKDINQASIISNFIAPEHLQIISCDEEKLLKNINNAGAIFLGNYSPEAVGDYIAGPSHTLPTEGTSRFASGLSVFDFLKRISIIKCNQEGFNKLSNSAQLMAENEGLNAHKLSLEIRNNKN